MSKDPAALWYIDKWISSTNGMSADVRGWYMDMILFQFDRGCLPNDINELAGMCRVRPDEFDRFKHVFEHVLKHKFQLNDEGMLVNEVAGEIIRAREVYKVKRSAAGKMSVAVRILRSRYKASEKFIRFFKAHAQLDFDLKNEQVFKQVFEHLFQLFINENEIIIKNNSKEKRVQGEKPKTESEPAPVLTVPTSWEQDRFFELWKRWTRYKVDQFKFRYKSIDSEQTAINELHRESQGNFDEAVAIINYSISKAYKGFKREWWLNGTATMDQQIKQAQGAPQSYKSFSTKVVPV